MTTEPQTATEREKGDDVRDNRCDIGLTETKRCRNPAVKWIHAPDPFDGTDWPLAVCEAHDKSGPIIRLGPDRREQYKNMTEATP